MIHYVHLFLDWHEDNTKVETLKKAKKIWNPISQISTHKMRYLKRSHKHPLKWKKKRRNGVFLQGWLQCIHISKQWRVKCDSHTCFAHAYALSNAVFLDPAVVFHLFMIITLPQRDNTYYYSFFHAIWVAFSSSICDLKKLMSLPLKKDTKTFSSCLSKPLLPNLFYHGKDKNLLLPYRKKIYKKWPHCQKCTPPW